MILLVECGQYGFDGAGRRYRRCSSTALDVVREKLFGLFGCVTVAFGECDILLAGHRADAVGPLAHERTELDCDLWVAVEPRHAGLSIGQVASIAEFFERDHSIFVE